jgi:hypothetical protein
VTSHLSFSRLLIVAAAMGVAALAPARASTFTGITNGNFASNTATYNNNGTTIGASVTNSDLTGWNITSCLANCQSSLANTDSFAALALGNVGTAGLQLNLPDLNGTVNFWSGPGGTAPSAQAFTEDAGIQTVALYQTVSNLTVGSSYMLSFSQATMQASESGESPAGFTAAWNVYFGTGPASNAYSAPTAVSSTMVNPYQGSTSWVAQTMTFTATAATETLSFFATGSNGQPPFLLLDGISLTQTSGTAQSVPEPASLAMFGVGLAGFMVIRRSRKTAVA